jgi:2,4-dienoyl-CoA reductase-like NADH-dependent reductase (Old Yellow Enzyme family)/thioredoxin reductase
MAAPYSHIFSPGRIGSLQTANRLVMPPMATNFAAKDGKVNQRHLAYYRARARGGVGYITCEHTGVLWEGKAFEGMTLLHTDENTAGFAALVDAVHAEGSKLVIQLNHAGRQTSRDIIGATPLAPSDLPCPLRLEEVQELDQTGIAEIVASFAAAARRVQEAGADGLEIHMAHGYLLSTFLSPFANIRSDAYGSDLQGRLKMPLEVLAAVRKEVGSEFPVICRLSAEEFVSGGLTIGDSKLIARALEDHGADAIHVSGGIPAAHHYMIPSYYVAEGLFAPLAEEIKSVVDVPVIVVGRIRTPELAEDILARGQADFVSLGRALIADPQLPQKARQGRADDIRPCISCMRCTIAIREGGLACAVNPEAGREELFGRARAGQAKTLWVVGGGPAGMKAAEVAARRGHRVTLFEKTDRLGGKIPLAAAPPYKKVLMEFVEHLSRQLEKLPVEVVLNSEFSPQSLGSQPPDVIIVATGGRPLLPPLEGLEQSEAIPAELALSGEAELGARVLIVGGGAVGSELADLLSEQGKQVTLVEMQEGIALDAMAHFQHFLNQRLGEKQVKVLTSTKAVRLEPGGLLAQGPQGEERLSGFDSLVVCLGWQPDNSLGEALRKRGFDAYVAGDASENGEIMEAVWGGAQAALAL